MTSLDSSRREQTRIRRALRRRRRLRMGASAALGSLAMLGVSGAAVGTAAGEDLRAAAGLQLVNMAVPLLATQEPVRDGATTGNVTETKGSTAEQHPAEQHPAEQHPAEQPPAGESDEQAAAEQAAAEQAAARAADEAAAMQAAEEAAEAVRAAVPVDDPAAAKAYAASMLASRGWEASQLTCLDRLWTKESEWLTSATNSSSGAYGIAQSLPAEKMAATGADWAVNYRTQIDWGLQHISSRYGSPCNALNFHHANNWY
ncbi:hypothetical protein LJ754_15515 [Arthrobacter sp. zg-Y40]|uniref:aggregation-promoting factor C-terminal-like domain-containing protein n=1 Tax=Arthrobacter sp. zg-Y40 TaxID=2886939 RepID=UPI001D1564D5|nr:hypothetical protein [Arthrobacter sp. zg-Y40]